MMLCFGLLFAVLVVSESCGWEKIQLIVWDHPSEEEEEERADPARRFSFSSLEKANDIHIKQQNNNNNNNTDTNSNTQQRRY